MDDVLRGLDFSFAYLDDILVFSRSPEEHEQHFRILFGRLQVCGILINPAKCVFRTPEVTFLVYKVSVEVSQTLEDRVADLKDSSSQDRQPAPTLPGHAELLQTIPATRSSHPGTTSRRPLRPQNQGLHPIT
jgi:hypothetical protein